MLATLSEDLTNLALRHEQVLVLRDLTLINITIAVVSCASSFCFAFFALNRELAPWVTFQIIGNNINFIQSTRHLINDRRNVIDTDLTVFVTLEQQKPFSLFIVVRIDSGDWHFLLDAHIVKLCNQLTDTVVWLSRGRWPHNPDPQRS